MTSTANNTKATPQAPITTTLLPRYEQSPLLDGQEAICYATFFSGTPPISFLRQRVEQIVTLNPVLGGRLKRTLRGICVKVPSDSTTVNMQDHFLVQDTTVSNQTSPLGVALPHFIPYNRAAVKGKSPLFVVAVLINKPMNQFCVVISVSHLIADGATFYNLLKMLDIKIQPWALTFNLDADDHNNLAEDAEKVIPNMNIMMLGILPHFHHPVRFGASLITTRVLAFPSFCLHAGQWRWKRYDLSKSWIESQKAVAMAAKPSPNAFVSTNDCLVSWFLKTSNVEFAAMYLNLRDKVPQITSDHAGNYMRPVTFQRGEFETPWLIREAISGKEYGSSVTKTGGKYRAPPKLTSKFGVVSNVCGLFHQLELPGECQFVEHHYTLRNNAIGVGNPYCTVYMSKPGQVCILTNITFDQNEFV
ncbi:UNVERIFIED_CONTAM: hypothetical protein HDU68_003156 [Siphonaria sp. JEL0065]|nr:hypothetical protein HDU68_003156 [Siphonaria sp. JEL0065]